MSCRYINLSQNQDNNENNIRRSNNLLVESVGASPKPGPTVGRPLGPPAPGTTRPLLAASSRRTRTDAGTMLVTVLSSCAAAASPSAQPQKTSHALQVLQAWQDLSGTSVSSAQHAGKSAEGVCGVPAPWAAL